MSLTTLFRNLSCNARLPALSRSLATRVRPSPEPRGTHLLPTASLDNTLIPNTDSVHTPSDFLKAIGRSVDTKVEDWDEFWQQTTGRNLRSAGVGVRDRRYVLWCMEKYRQGLPIPSFAHDPRPKKTIRGWGPSVQNGKRIRSRRVRTPTSPTTKSKRKEQERKDRKKLKREEREELRKAALLL
ncbi:hypothetical protein C8F04DRAFT_1128858 [Mycena alexandri]|uniref:Small ribosomal subunit protein mS41 n=1 Tax=Mycena alexandri TaxID=1745969 RepID=A0AAD6SE92_9AGAR|nr:hypothetical protein C8F04DRAFT_1128858 [Mycena alexandri]